MSKIRNAFASAATVGMLLVPGWAQAAAYFDGIAYVTAVTSGCEGSITGFNPGLELTLHYRAKTSSGDSPDALLVESMAGDGLIVATDSAGTLRGTGTFSATVLSAILFQSLSNGSGGTSKLTFSPAAVTTATKNTTFTGTIQNLFGISSCILTVQGALTQR